jgi:hypothetical protein
MWFETDMALKTIQSVQSAAENTSLEVKCKFCFNCQTRFDIPEDGDPRSRFDLLLENELVKNSELVWKTDLNPFYNVGDWRRDCYDKDNITVWGESDCYVPETYFWYIENAFATMKNYPFIISTKQKKMWDESWKPTEHEALQNFTLEQTRSISNKFVTGEGYLSLEELNNFNNSFSENHSIVQSSYYKGDGALLCLSPNMPTPFIDPELHMCGEDTYFFTYCRIKRIPLYNISYYLKGHNTNHPLKKVRCKRTEDHKKAFESFDKEMRIVAQNSLSKL